MVFRSRFVAGLLGWGLGVAGLGALGASGCGGTSVKHLGDGAGGAGSGGTGGRNLPSCGTVSEFAGPEYVDWNVSPDQSCKKMEVRCFEAAHPLLDTCLDGGVPEPGSPGGDVAPPAPPKDGCPNVRTLCSTQIGCCEVIYTFIAGPQVDPQEPGAGCCYLMLRG